MTLTTHALVGAAAASLFPNYPYIAFAAGFASHFAIDAIPHWDYHEFLYSLKRDTARPLESDLAFGKYFLHDISIIALDAILGTVLALLVLGAWLGVPAPIVLIGAWAGMYPDFLQFVYMKTRLEAMEWLQRFHIWVQKGKNIYPQPLVGLTYQAALVAVVVVLFRFIASP